VVLDYRETYRKQIERDIRLTIGKLSGGNPSEWVSRADIVRTLGPFYGIDAIRGAVGHLAGTGVLECVFRKTNRGHPGLLYRFRAGVTPPADFSRGAFMEMVK
jgi:hypothetical protein